MLKTAHRLDISGLHAAYRQGGLRAQDVLSIHLGRIDDLDAGLRSFIQIDREGASKASVESDRRIAAGAMRPLEGVPVAIKANIAMAGLEWSAGMALRRGVIAREDAEVVALLRQAGAVILGSLNMHEAALGLTTNNPWFGVGLNPHGEGRTPGGSSGGSAAAVAAGLCFASLGTDTLGSIRIPAAFNGVFGLKPTHAAISPSGVVPVCEELDDVGPLARSIADLKIVWDVVGAGAQGRTSPRFKRLLTLADLGGISCDPSVMEAMKRAEEGLGPLSRAALQVPPLAAIRVSAFLRCTHELTNHLGDDRTRRGDLISSDMHRLLDYRLREDTTPDVVDDAARALHEAVAQDGVILLPTAPHAAFVQGSSPPTATADFTSLANVSGLPSLSVPAGRDKEGMPIAVQLVGPAGSDAALIDLGGVLDRHLAGYSPPSLFEY